MATHDCGVKNSDCTFSELPVCAPDMTGYHGMMRIYVKPDKEGIIKTRRFCEEDNPFLCVFVPEPEIEPITDDKDLRKKPGSGEKNLEMEDANNLLNDGWFERHGIYGLCRSEYIVGQDKDGGNVYALYGYDEYMDKLDRLVYKNDVPQIMAPYANTPIELLASEARCLYGKLNLTARDMVCAPISCPRPGPRPGENAPFKEIASETVPGRYLLTGDGARLSQIIEGAATLTCLDEVRKEAVIGSLKGLQKRSSWWNIGMDRLATYASLALNAIFIGIIILQHRSSNARSDKQHSDIMKNMEAGRADNAHVDVRDIGYEHITEDPIEMRMKELSETGTFKQPYFDSGGFVAKIIDKAVVPQGDQNNYYSVGPSRSGKSASTLEGLPQAYLVGKMTEAERKAYFDKVTANMQPEEAAEYIRVTTKNAEHVGKRLAENGFKGLKVFDLRPSRLKGKGNAWYGNEEAILERAFEQMAKFRAEGNLVIVFTDEFSEARGEGNGTGHIPLRQRLKKFQERLEFSFGQATTIEEIRDSFQGDTAAMARVEPLFHEAPEPLEVIKRLTQRPYVKDTYSVTRLDPAAMKAVYLVGRRVDPRASSMTVAESYFTKVLQAAKDEGITHLTSDFVRKHYDKEYAGQHGRYLLTDGNTDRAISHETDEVRAENKADFDAYRELIREEAGRNRMGPMWSDVLEAEQCIAEGTDAAAAPKSSVDTIIDRMNEIPQYKRMFDAIGPERTREVAEWIDREWNLLGERPETRGMQERLRASDALYGRRSAKGGIPDTFVRLKLEEIDKPARAAGLMRPGEEREEVRREEGREGKRGAKGSRGARAPRPGI